MWELIVAGNEASRAKVTSLSATYFYEGTNAAIPNERQAYTGNFSLKRRGDHLWFRKEAQVEMLDQGRKMEDLAAVVVNDRYHGITPNLKNPRPLVYGFDHASIREMKPSYARRIAAEQPLKPEEWGFVDYCFLREIRQKYTAPGTALRVEEAVGDDGHEQFRIVWYHTDTNNQAAIQYWFIDPNKGFLITRLVGYLPNGELLLDRKYTIENVDHENDIWIGTGIDFVVYGPPSENRPDPRITPLWTQRARALELHVNPALQDSEFEFAALGFDKNQAVILWEDLVGLVERRVYVGDRLLPQALAEEIRRPPLLVPRPDEAGVKSGNLEPHNHSVAVPVASMEPSARRPPPNAGDAPKGPHLLLLIAVMAAGGVASVLLFFYVWKRRTSIEQGM